MYNMRFKLAVEGVGAEDILPKKRILAFWKSNLTDDVLRAVQALVFQSDDGDKEDYEIVTAKLLETKRTREFTVNAAHNFRKMLQEDREPITRFAERLKANVKLWETNPELIARELRQQFLAGFKNSHITATIMLENYDTFDKYVARAVAMDNARKGALDMNPGPSGSVGAAYVDYINTCRPKNGPKFDGEQINGDKVTNCGYCGGTHKLGFK